MRVLCVPRSALGLLLMLAAQAAPAFEHPGGPHTQAQLDQARAAILAGEEPWLSAYADVVQFAEEGLAEQPSPVAVFDSPGDEDPVRNAEMKENLKRDTEAAYYCALMAALDIDLTPAARADHANKTREILVAWASTTLEISGGALFPENGKLKMAYIGSAMLMAGDLILDDPGWTQSEKNQFLLWVKFIYRRNVVEIMDASGNRGAWGLYAAMLADHLLDDAPKMQELEVRLREIIDEQVEPDGTLPDAMARGEKSLWYTYFTLAPLTHAVETLRNDLGTDLYALVPPSGGTLLQGLHRFHAGVLDPTGWSTIPQVLVPGGADDWGANLLFAMGHVYGEPGFVASATTPLERRNGAWKEADLFVPVSAEGIVVPLVPAVAYAWLATGLLVAGGIAVQRRAGWIRARSGAR